MMAEGFARYLAGSQIEVESAGTVVTESDPYCRWAMNEAGIDISNQSADPLESKDLAYYSHVVSIGRGAREALERLRSATEVENWQLPDPSRGRANPVDTIKSFRAVRNELERRVKRLLLSALKA